MARKLNYCVCVGFMGYALLIVGEWIDPPSPRLVAFAAFWALQRIAWLEATRG